MTLSYFVPEILGERTPMKCNNILEAMGNTPLIRLNRVTKDLPAELYIKADYLNPGGSVKDRIAVAMIDEAERKGLVEARRNDRRGNLRQHGRGPGAGRRGARL